MSIEGWLTLAGFAVTIGTIVFYGGRRWQMVESHEDEIKLLRKRSHRHANKIGKIYTRLDMEEEEDEEDAD